MDKMKPFKDLITIDEAKHIIQSNTAPKTRTEIIGLQEAGSQVLARDIVAELDVPGFSRSAMDGYAVKARNTLDAARHKPMMLKFAGKIFAGQKADIELQEGQCIQIATGAMVPKGADAVVIVEETSRDGDTVRIFKPVYSGANISKADSDIAKGTVMMKVRTVLSPPKIGVLAALGIDSVEVFERPKVMIFPTGEEIIRPGTEREEAQIYDINSYTLAALLAGHGADVEILEIAGDDPEDLKKCINKAAQADYAIFSGGSSVGERDYLAQIIEETGELLFHGIALKPGKPTVFGKVKNTLVFGMPGYPTSCLTNAYVLLLPSVCAMGARELEIKRERHELGERIVSTIGRHHLYTVRVDNGKAMPAFKESGAITSMSEAVGWIEIGQNTEFLENGTVVEVNYF